MKSEKEVLILVELFYNFVISTLVGLFGVHLLNTIGVLFALDEIEFSTPSPVGDVPMGGRIAAPFSESL